MNKLQYLNIEPRALKAALAATAIKRGFAVVIKDYRNIMDIVRNSDVMLQQWRNYQKNFEYAIDISFPDTCDVIIKLMDSLNEVNNYTQEHNLNFA